MNTDYGHLPWDLAPSLTPARLTTVGAILLQPCQAALDNHEPAQGDTPIVLGLRTHVRQMHAITEACQLYDWLRVRNPTLRFEFSIDETIFRFWRGDPENPSDRILIPGPAEGHQAFQLGLDLGESPADLMWRYTFRLRGDGSIEATYVQQFSTSGGTLCLWQVPIETSAPALPPPQDVSEPDVGLLEDEQDQDDAQGASA